MANVIKHKRGSGSDPVANDLVVGEVAIRTDVGKLFTKMDNGSVAEIAGGGSDIAINTLSSSSGTGGGSATFNGSAYRFTLSQPPSVSAQQLLVSINGVIQKPVAGTGQPSEGFSVDGTDIILGDAPATGSDFFILTFKSLGVSEPADNSVTSAKIVDGAIVNADINASAAIAGSKIADFVTNNANNRVLTASGTANSLIGEDNLTFTGSILTVTNSSGAAELTLVTPNNTDSGVYFNDGSNSGAISYQHSDDSMRFRVNTTEKMRIDSSGNVGIGTTSPSSLVHFASTAPELRLEDTDHVAFAQINAEGGNLRFDADQGNQENLSKIHFRIDGSERMRIDSSGNVMIGLTSTGNKFHVEGTTTGSRFGVDDSASGITALAITNEVNADFEHVIFTNKASFGSSVNIPICFHTNGKANEKMRIDTSGRLLIGTTTEGHSSADNFTVAESGDCGITIRSGTTNLGSIFFSDATSGGGEYAGFIQYDHNTQKFFIGTGDTGNTDVTIDSSGRVGIGTTSLNARLTFGSGHYTVSNSGQAINGLHAKGTPGNAGEYSGGISFACGGSGAAAIAARQMTSDVDVVGLSFFTHDTSDGSANAVEKVRINDGGSVNFNNGIVLGNGLTISANNTLDDYEEGTWTATLAPTSGEFTPTTNTNTCTYTKIGRQVTVVGIAKMTTPSSLGSYTNDSINHALNVSGLPFTIQNAINGRSAATLGVGGDIQFPNGVLATHGNANTTSFAVFVNKSNGGTRTSPTINTSTAMNFHFSFTYFI